MVEDLRNFFLPRLYTHKHRELELFDSRIPRLSRVVNTNCRSVIDFFGRVVGSSWLPRRTTYPELRQTSGTHSRRILENPRACLLHATYTQAGITDGRCRHDVDLGLGISSYRRSGAVRDSCASACIRMMQSFFLHRFIDESIGTSFWKNTPHPDGFV